ncbi:hypothetical protein [Streptomyces sp. NPDC056405]|uniref:hypothetical protein n=1 Tax=Streptomyces sp. NPDC056405 TaxID=3345811 RepID=UPI0035DA727D
MPHHRARPSRRRLLAAAAAAAVSAPLAYAVSAQAGIVGSSSEPSRRRHGAMRVGTNFWFLGDDGQAVAGSRPWTGESPFRRGLDWRRAYTPGRQSTVNVWNPQFLNEVSDYACLRFMDWGKTNLSPITSWSQRTHPAADQTRVGGADYSVTKSPGLAYEWMIDLCNRTGADAWICMPLKADDYYFRRCAELFRDRLDPKLKVYVELHNELWLQKAISDDSRNTSQYAGWHSERYGYGTGRPEDFANVFRFLARRSSNMWWFWHEAFGRASKDRFVPVVAGQGINPDYGAQLLDALDDRTVNYRRQFPKAYAIAPYFAANAEGRSAEAVSRSLRDDIRRQAKVTEENHAIWAPRGVDLVCYEGGQHMVGSGTAAFNRRPDMRQLYKEYLDGLAPYVTLFNHYAHCGTPRDSGNWGAKEYTGQPASRAPKFQALKEWTRENAPR